MFGQNRDSLLNSNTTIRTQLKLIPTLRGLSRDGKVLPPLLSFRTSSLPSFASARDDPSLVYSTCCAHGAISSRRTRYEREHKYTPHQCGFICRNKRVQTKKLAVLLPFVDETITCKTGFFSCCFQSFPSCFLFLCLFPFCSCTVWPAELAAQSLTPAKLGKVTSSLAHFAHLISRLNWS